MAEKSRGQILLCVLCVILMLIGLIVALTGGLIGIIIGILTMILGCLGFCGALMKEKTPLLIFEVCCGVLLLLTVVSLVLIFTIDGCIAPPFDPISGGSGGQCGGIANIVLQCLLALFYLICICLSSSLR